MANLQGAAGRRVLTSSQRDEFLATGVVHLPGVIPKPATEAMAGRLWALLAARDGMLRGRPETWSRARPAQFAELRKAGAFAEMASPGLGALLDAFFDGVGWTPPRHWGLALVTFPTGGTDWRVPGSAWHLDVYPRQVLSPWPEYVRVFTFLAPVEPGGGGTVYLAGSHRLTLQAMAGGAQRSADVRAALIAQSPWIAALCSAGEDRGRPIADRAVVRGVELRVGEMTGEAGDVVLMHPATLHAPSPNVRDTPRMMLAESIYRA